MTREEIMAMPAGRELDALVAEKVIGWRRIELHETWRSPSGETTPHFPAYSTDIAAAYEMERAISEKGITIEYSQAILSMSPAPACTTGEVDIYEVWHLLHEAPEFRCRAALIAVQPVSPATANTR